MIRSLLFLLLIIFPGISRAQFNINSFIGSARNDIDLSDIKDRLDYLGENRISPPPIDRLEFRIRTRDLNFSPDDYRLRITPVNPAEIIRNRQYQQSAVNALNDDMQFSLNNALKVRYQMILHYLFYKARLNLISDEIILLNDELKVIRSKGEYEELDADDLVNTEREITEAKVDKAGLENKMKRAELTIKGLYSFEGSININIDQLISIENINSMILQIGSVVDSSNLYLAHEKTKYDLKESKYKVDLSESFRNLGFIEAQYRSYRDDEFSQQLGFEIGFRLPIFNDDKADRQRSYLNLIEDKAKISKEENRLSHEKQVAQLNVLSSISKYEIVNSRLEQLFPGNSAEIYKKELEKNPGKFLSIKENHIRMKNLKLDNQEDAYLDYIEFLDVYGKLTEAPLRNYLTPSLDTL